MDHTLTEFYHKQRVLGDRSLHAVPNDLALSASEECMAASPKTRRSEGEVGAED